MTQINLVANPGPALVIEFEFPRGEQLLRRPASSEPFASLKGPMWDIFEVGVAHRSILILPPHRVHGLRQFGVALFIEVASINPDPGAIITITLRTVPRCQFTCLHDLRQSGTIFLPTCHEIVVTDFIITSAVRQDGLVSDRIIVELRELERFCVQQTHTVEAVGVVRASLIPAAFGIASLGSVTTVLWEGSNGRSTFAHTQQRHTGCCMLKLSDIKELIPLSVVLACQGSARRDLA